jgi:hypothetical protein
MNKPSNKRPRDQDIPGVDWDSEAEVDVETAETDVETDDELANVEIEPEPEANKDETNVQRPKPMKGWAWEYFNQLPDYKVKREAQCKECQKKGVHKVVKCKEGNTSGLLKHLRSSHLTIYEAKRPAKKQLTIKKALRSQNPIEGNPETVRKKLVDFVIKGDHPFSIVEEPAFRELLETIHALPKDVILQQIGANVLTRELGTRFNDALEQKKRELGALTSKVSFTTDMWTDLNQRGFMGITAHYINVDWILRSIVLDLVEVPGEHTAAVLGGGIC